MEQDQLEPQERHSYDEDTGSEENESLIRQLVRQQAKEIVEGQDLEAMLGTPGWQLVETHIRDMQAAYTDQLVTAMDIDEIRRLQETVKACANILGFVFGKIAEAKSASRSEQDPS